MKKLVIILVMAFFVVNVSAISRQDAQQPMQLIPLLAALSKSYNCYFTLEEASDDGEPTNIMESHEATRYPGSKNLHEELEYIKEAIPAFSYEINKKNPNLIHVIDKRLSQNGYALNRILHRMNFDGTVYDFISAIGDQGIPVSSPEGMLSHELLAWDLTSKIHVHGEEITVRDALSNYIALEGRNRILWIARTKMGQNQTSYVYFLGPTPKHSKK